MGARITYAIVTPVRNEAENLPRLAGAVDAQTTAPEKWIVVDTGSTDQTVATAETMMGTRPWMSVLRSPAEPMRRGAPIVRAIHLAAATLEADPPDVFVKLDADVSFESDYFARLLAAFAVDPRLGIASGTAWEERAGEWCPLFGTRTSVWGASRAYRWTCFEQVSPLEERMGWDGVDELRANVRGWQTRTLRDLPFRHHRLEGGRDRSRWAAWSAQGDVAHFMGYRFSYLLARATYRGIHEPAALGMVSGYLSSVIHRRPGLADLEARSYLRRRQRWRELPARLREARGQ